MPGNTECYIIRIFIHIEMIQNNVDNAVINNFTMLEAHIVYTISNLFLLFGKINIHRMLNFYSQEVEFPFLFKHPFKGKHSFYFIIVKQIYA